MTQEKINDLLIQTLSSVLWDGSEDNNPLVGLTASQSEQLMETAALQGVEGVVAYQQSRQSQSDEALAAIGRLLYIKDDYEQRLEVMVKLCELFSRSGIDVLFLKGASLCSLYPIPFLRQFSDVDYYLFGKSEVGDALLKSVGIVPQEYFHHHTQASAKGILMENHYDFFDRLNHQCNCVLDDALKELAEKAGRSFPFVFESHPEIQNAYCMSPTMNAIFLMRHMSAHFVAERVTMRQLWDWALFLKQDGTQVDWHYVLALYKRCQLLQFAQIVQYLLNEHLLCGRSFPEGTCPISPTLFGEDRMLAERVWQSVLTTESPNAFKKYGFRYMIREFRVFAQCRWKHHLVYPQESYCKLFFNYAWSYVKRATGLLSH